MDCYVGAKIIKAELSNLEVYKKKKYKDKAQVHEGDSNIIGYMVFYPPIGDGTELYLSWSPKAVFEKAYRKVEQCEISLLLNK